MKRPFAVKTYWRDVFVGSVLRWSVQAASSTAREESRLGFAYFMDSHQRMRLWKAGKPVRL
jgi:hypothetical protein